MEAGMLDVSVAYNRYRFLGHEFLTWLWYMIDLDFEGLLEADPDMESLAIGNRIVLENHRNNRDETITIRGDGAGLEEGIMALAKGAKVTEMQLVFRAAEFEWRFTVKGESLSLSGLKTPQTQKPESLEDMEGAVLERLYLIQRVTDLVEKLYAKFIRQRLDPQWERKTVYTIMDWIQREK
jgi:hypothetical protein